MNDPEAVSRIDRLLDAIELVKQDQRQEACDLLRELIRENNDFEDAWLWMAVAVDSVDKSEICFDNVLRINPKNVQAAGALYRLRRDEMHMERRRAHLRSYRDFSLGMMWVLVIILLYAGMFTGSRLARERAEVHTVVPPQPVLTAPVPTQPSPDRLLPVRPDRSRIPLPEGDIDD